LEYHSTAENLGISRKHSTLLDGMTGNPTARITQIDRHSGISSLQIDQNSKYTFSFYSENKNTCVENDNSNQTNLTNTETGLPPDDPADPCLFLDCEDSPDEVNECVCLPGFKPRVGSYVVSCWVKSEPNKGKLIIKTRNGNLELYPSGSIIDGWQRLESEFYVPNGAVTNLGDLIEVSFVNTSGSSKLYIDDFRIHPYESTMSTVVYDPKTGLPLATHDNYNFTTFYNYDESLNLVKVRVETIDGIKTINEIETGIYREKN